LQLDPAGVQVTEALSSKFEEDCKLISEYWADRVEKGIPSDSDELEECV